MNRNLSMTVCALAVGVSGVALGQVQATEQWTAREFLPGVNGTDVGVDLLHWTDPVTEKNWVYVTGYHTTASGATVFATYKYQADWPGPTRPPVQAVAFYPDPAIAVGQHRASALSVDPLTGDIYVTGQSTGGEGNADYVTIKYDKNLDAAGGLPFQPWASQGGEPVGVRRYDGPAQGHDRAVDVMFTPGPYPAVFVTGTSWGGTSGNDIVSVRYDTAGNLAAQWPDVGSGVGVRRYNNAGVNGHDEAVELGVGYMQAEGSDAVMVVLGTSWGGAANANDFVTIFYDAFGVEAWAQRYNGPANGSDVAVALSAAFYPFQQNGFVAVTGVSPHFNPTQSASSGAGAAAGSGGSRAAAPADTDYATVTYLIPSGVPFWTDIGFGPGARHWNGPGLSSASDDVVADIEFYSNGQPPFGDGEVWVTGRVRNGTTYDVGTVIYLNDVAGSVRWESVFSPTDASSEFVTGIKLFGCQAYVTGWTVDNSTQLVRYLTIRYDDGCIGIGQIDWLTTYAGVGMPNQARAVWTRPTSNGSFPDIFVTGGSGAPGSGEDMLTIRYTQDLP